MLNSLRSDLTNLKMEVRLEMMNRAKQTDSATVADMLSTLSADIRNDLASLKKRQDQLYRKQYLIHCTLAGETTPVSSTYGIQLISACLVFSSSAYP